jgi:hypothetical protein
VRLALQCIYRVFSRRAPAVFRTRAPVRRQFRLATVYLPEPSITFPQTQPYTTNTPGASVRRRVANRAGAATPQPAIRQNVLGHTCTTCMHPVSTTRSWETNLTGV